MQNGWKRTSIRVGPVRGYLSGGVNRPLWRRALENGSTASLVTKHTTADSTGDELLCALAKFTAAELGVVPAVVRQLDQQS